MFVIRLRLHMCSEHEHHHHNIQCPVCTKTMSGSVYELHVLREHSLLLMAERYQFTPRVLAVKKVNGAETIQSKISKIIMNQHQQPSNQSYSIDFNVENPWHEILSTTNRRKRSVDAVTVGSLRKKMKTESSPNIGQEHSSIPQMLWQHGDGSKFQTLRKKIEFISTLDSNTYYKKYLRSLRHLKMKKTLLLKYASRMTDIQIGKVKGEIRNNEQRLSELSFMDKTPTQNGKILGEEKKNVERVLHVYPQINLGNNNKTASHSKPVPPPPKYQPRSMPVIDLGENLTIKSEYPARESVIALNIPMEDIVEKNLIIDIKSEV